MTRIAKAIGVATLAAAGVGLAGAGTPAEAQLQAADCLDMSGTLCGTVTQSICFNLVIMTVCKGATENYYEDTKEEEKEVTKT